MQGLTGQQGHRYGKNYAKNSINLERINPREVSLSTPTFARILRRLSLELKHEGPNWNLYRGDLLLFAGTNSNAKDVVDWIMKTYIPDLIVTGSVPPPPPLTKEEEERALRRLYRKQEKARPKMTRAQAAARARAKRW